MFVTYADGFTTRRLAYPKPASPPAPRGKNFPKILNARCAVSAKTSSRKSNMLIKVNSHFQAVKIRIFAA